MSMLTKMDENPTWILLNSCFAGMGSQSQSDSSQLTDLIVSFFNDELIFKATKSQVFMNGPGSGVQHWYSRGHNAVDFCWHPRDGE